MLRPLLDNLRNRRILKEAARALRRGDLDALAALVAAHRDRALCNILRALLARGHAEDDDRAGALRAFNDLYGSVKTATAGTDRHVKLFALYNLALLRNSLGDAAYIARKARGLKSGAVMRFYLPMPLIEERPTPGPAITATL